VLAALTALGVSIAAFAAASTATLKISTATSTGSGRQVAVNAQGRTLYQLSGESARHLLCRSRACLMLWPPLTAASRATKLKLGAGLHGRLALLRRTNGTLQVTLNGHPLYRYAGDRRRGSANGEGIRSFGGIWHAVAAAGQMAPTSQPAPAPTPAPYTYPTTTTPPPASPTTTTTPTTPAPPPYKPPYGY